MIYMSARVFFDTNVLFYAYDTDVPGKQSIAQRLLAEALEKATGFVSAQVLGEFFHSTVVRRQLFTSDEGERAVRVLSQFGVVEIDASLVSGAIAIHRQFHLSYWDSLILATAKRCDCKTVLSEDFNHEQDYGGVRVKNPFRE